MSRAPEELRIALGQCFWIGLDGTEADEPSTREIFDAFQPGGIILFLRNVQSCEQVIRLNRALQERSRIPLLVAVDQEGGSVERLHNLIGSIPPAMALSAGRDRALVHRIHSTHARLLSALGFNVNFTPVLDLALRDANNGLGTRCFSDHPGTVAEYAAEVIRAHTEEGVLVCGKHFPGLGDTDRDSHFKLPVVSRPWRKVVQNDLLPYKKLLPELPIIMVNHAIYPQQNAKLPASIAPEIVSDYLFGKWDYHGLSISDDLNMAAVSDIYNPPEAAEEALMAGNHAFLICKPQGVVTAYRRLLGRAQGNTKLAAAIFRGSSRMMALKLQKPAMPPKLDVDIQKEIELLRRYGRKASELAITRLRKGVLRPLPANCTLYAPVTKWISDRETGASEVLTEAGCYPIARIFPMTLPHDQALQLAAASATEWNIVVLANAANHGGQVSLLTELIRRGKKVAVISGAFPIDPLPDEVRVAVASYWTAPEGLRAAALALTGRMPATGKLPLM